MRELPDSTRTAVEAARALGCEVRQIVKSLVFRVAGDDVPILALVAGDHKLDETWMEHRFGQRWTRADPELARSATGFAIGGVPPVGHPEPLRTYIDYDLLEQREVWAAAGHPNAVCRLRPIELLRITSGTPVPVVPIAPTVHGSGPWVTFDCYGTLVDWRSGLLAVLAHAIDSPGGPDAARWFPAYLGAEQKAEAGPYRTYREILTGAIGSVADQLGLPIDAGEAARASDSIPDWPAFPDSRGALTTLRAAGYRVAVLSNIDRDLLSMTLERHALPTDLVVTAEDVRSYKPGLAHWIRFLKETGASPGDCWHVSAGYEYDVPPARALGFETIYVARYGPPPEEATGPSVRSLPDAVALIVDARRAGPAASSTRADR